jgi:hypothetical protein
MNRYWLKPMALTAKGSYRIHEQTWIFYKDEHQHRAFPANTLITLLRLHSLAFGFGTFAAQKTELPRLTTVCSRKARH